MNKKLIYFIALLFSVLNSGCTSNNDTTSKFDSTESYSKEEIFKFIEAPSNLSEKAEAQLYLGKTYIKENKFDSALTQLNKSLVLFKHNSNKDRLSLCHVLIGNIQKEIGNHDLSIDQYVQAIETSKDKERQMQLSIYLASCYWKNGEWTKAYNTLTECTIFFESNDKYYLAESHLVLGNILKSYAKSTNFSQKTNESFEHYFIALENYSQQTDKARALNNIGLLYTSIEKYERAIIYLDSALTFQNDESEQMKIRYNLGSAYLETNQLEKSLNQFRVVISQNNQLTGAIRNCYIQLIELNTLNGNTDIATQLFTEYNSKIDAALQDKANIEESAKQEMLEAHLIKQEYKEIKQKNLTRNILIYCGLVALVLLSHIIYRRKTRIITSKQGKLKQISEQMNEVMGNI